MKPLPFSFIFDHLPETGLRVNPMFGAHAVYLGDRILLIVRHKPQHEDSNGIWIATSYEFHESLRKEIPRLHSIEILTDGKKESGWQMIHHANAEFESDALHICELIRKGDPRIGRIPASKKKKK